jgi:cytochrome c-type biogenesis protein CcsB
VSLYLLRFAALCQIAATGAYFLNLLKPGVRKWLPWVGWSLLAVGVLAEGIAIGDDCRVYGGAEFLTFRGSLVLLALLCGAAYLVVDRVQRLPVVGAFITPLILFTMVPTLGGHGPSADPRPPILRSGWLPLHVSAAFLGIALFTLAFGVALMYLLMEREVKGKHFGALFSRLPSLDKLDALNQRLVRWGFVVFSVALITGSFFARQAWGSFWQWDPKEVFSLVVWLLYAGLLQMRLIVGWHGRRVAVLTMVGFALVILSFVGLSIVPSGRHGGDFQ